MTEPKEFKCECGCNSFWIEIGKNYPDDGLIWKCISCLNSYKEVEELGTKFIWFKKGNEESWNIYYGER